MINKYSTLNGAKYISLDGLQNYMVFSPVSKYLSSFSKTDNIYSWTSKEISEESIKTPFTSENSFFPKWVDGYQLPKIKVNGNCLKQDRLSFLHRNVVNLYNTYELIT